MTDARDVVERGAKRRALPIALLLALAACAATAVNPLPEGYSGPVAHITDSGQSLGHTSAVLFYVAKVDGRRIDDSAAATARTNAGKGLDMTPVVIGRDVPAEPTTFTIVGTRIYAAPILSIIQPSYEVSGETKFTPLPGEAYVVKGEVGRDHSTVWVEDVKTGAVMGDRLEVKSVPPPPAAEKGSGM
jgi:hypothetical protein